MPSCTQNAWLNCKPVSCSQTACLSLADLGQQVRQWQSTTLHIFPQTPNYLSSVVMEQAIILLYLWRKRRHQKRSLCVHSINFSRSSVGIFVHLDKDLRIDEFKLFKFYRMSITSFDELLQRVEGRLMHKSTTMRDNIPPIQRLAVTLRYIVLFFKETSHNLCFILWFIYIYCKAPFCCGGLFFTLLLKLVFALD